MATQSEKSIQLTGLLTPMIRRACFLADMSCLAW